MVAALKRLTRTCQYCGSDISHMRDGTRFCMPKCRTYAWRLKQNVTTVTRNRVSESVSAIAQLKTLYAVGLSNQLTIEKNNQIINDLIAQCIRIMVLQIRFRYGMT